jgi:hypothetical protein
MADSSSEEADSDHDDDFDLDYYADQDDFDSVAEGVSSLGNEDDDPEAFSFECLTKEKAAVVVHETVEKLSRELEVLIIFCQTVWRPSRLTVQVTNDAARLLLGNYKWDEEALKTRSVTQQSCSDCTFLQ